MKNPRCKNCGKKFVIEKNPKTNLPRRIVLFCSTKCRKIFHNPPSEMPLISKNNRGAWGELIVAADLIRKGWHVLRSVTRYGPFDLAIYKNGKFLKVEVTIGKRKINGDTMFHPHSYTSYDVLAVVFPDGEINYTVSSATADESLFI